MLRRRASEDAVLDTGMRCDHKGTKPSREEDYQRHPLAFYAIARCRLSSFALACGLTSILAQAFGNVKLELEPCRGESKTGIFCS